MSSTTLRFAWLPPLLVGVCAAIAAEVALGILLYTGPGFMRSLTTVLAVQGAALAGGLWSAPGPRPDLVDELRRRWLHCLTAFLVAAAFGTAWSAVRELGGGSLGQGLGLAFLAAFPLYTCGAVLGGMASVAAEDASTRGPGAAAALGAGVGFVVTGALLPQAPIPASLLVGCLVLLSAAGMIYGTVLGHRLHVHVRASRRSPGGEVRVEDRRIPKGGLAARFLMEGEHVRRRVDLDERVSAPWDVAVTRALMPQGGQARRVLMLGGGASMLPRTLLEEHANLSVEVLERTGAVVELSRDHLGAQPGEGAGERLRVSVGNLEDLIADVRGPFDLVLVDTAALAPLGGVGALSRAAHARLTALVDVAGSMVWGPLAPEPGAPEPGNGWRQTVLTRARKGLEELIVIAHPDGREPPMLEIEDFSLVRHTPRQ